MAVESTLTPGTVLLGKYRVESLLGTGGMGQVVKASHIYLNTSVAIKILLPQMVDTPGTVARFLREAQAAVRLKSEHTARVIDVATLPDGTPMMIMEYLEGNDLSQILRHHGPQQPHIVCDLMLQACEGLSEAHGNGIVHRDIKPSNFFVTRRSDGTMLLKVLDFGISKTPIGYDDLTGTQTIIGTPAYMAPEQMKSAKLSDARSDVWSMGVVIYQLLAGRTPFEGETYAELVIKVAAEAPTPLNIPLPPGLAEVVFGCLEKDPNRRIPNVAELARLLAPFSSDPQSSFNVASRASRILITRAGQDTSGSMPLPRDSHPHFGTGPGTPAPMTPNSWARAPGSVSQGNGQLQTMPPAAKPSSKSWMIAGAVALVILAGAGGFIASQATKGDTKAAATPTMPETTKPETIKPETPPTPTEPAKADTAAADQAAADKVAADKASADKEAADKLAADKKTADDKAAADKLLADKKTADKAAADKLLADKKAAADKAAADKQAADEKRADKAEKLAAQKAADEKRAADKAKAKAKANDDQKSTKTKTKTKSKSDDLFNRRD
ncbi:MAG TPA: serine/threonine-protein kinase [Kofleriaceae bacterium]